MKYSAALVSRLLGLAAFTLLLCASTADAYRARLAWRPVAGAAGYTLYARQNGYPDAVAIDLGLLTADADGIIRYERGGLLVESTNVFALATYNGARVESPRSNELTVVYAVAATVVDSDSDGLTDAREDANLNLTREASETDRLRADTDGDGAGDGTEVAAGSDPLNAASRPGVPTPTRTATPRPTITPTRTRTPTPTHTATSTPARTPSPTPTPSPAVTATPAPPAPTVTPLDTGSIEAPLIVSVERVD